MSVWDARADVAQLSITRFFGAGPRRLVHMTAPPRWREPFHYWWLAHLVDVRLDAFARTGAVAWAGEAQRVADSIRRRNGGSLFNDYFDDMLWYALALDRLHTLTGDVRAGESARALWEHCVQQGWNDTHGASMAWRKSQLDYKNTPANGPFTILSARLGARGDARALDYAEHGFAWLTERMRTPDGIVLDGVNRMGDGRVDEWRFTYNQGVYIGAAVALFEATGDRGLLELACATARAAISELTAGEVFVGEDDGGDAGLFRGIFFRYLGGLLPHIEAGGASLVEFARGSTDQLWAHGVRDGWLLAGDDWRVGAVGRVGLATELSAVMAVEARAGLER